MNQYELINGINANPDIIDNLSDEQVATVVNGIEGLGAVQKAQFMAKAGQKLISRVAKMAPKPSNIGNMAINRQGYYAQIFDKYMRESPNVDKDLKNAYIAGVYQFRDHRVSVAKAVNALSSIDMITASDSLQKGICNLNNGQFEKGQIFFLAAIGLQYGQGSASTGQEATVSYDNLPAVIANGQFTFRANDKDELRENSCNIFLRPTEEEKGIYRLEQPFLIASQKLLKFFVEWGSASAANGYMKVLLVGGWLVR